MNLVVNLTGTIPEEMGAISSHLENPSVLHASIAVKTENFLKQDGATRAQSEHRTANRLGAKPTGHLAEAYQAIESVSDAESARLLIPRASRLRAAFGSYVLTPTESKYLTIPVHPDAYGKRAREFGDDLFFMRTGVTGTAVLARRVEGGEDFNLNTRTTQRRRARRFTQSEVLYVLAESADIEEDKNLIPFEKLEKEAQRATNEYLLELMERNLA